MTRRLTGIEIGSTHIKIIEAVRSEATIAVKKFSLLKTPPECILDGVISQIDPIKKVILEELRAKKYRSKKVVVVIQSSQIIIRNITMEKQSEKMTKSWLQMQMETFLPIESNQYQIDFKVVEEVEEEGQIKDKWMLVAAPNTVILPITHLIKDLKLRPISITIPSEALHHIFYPLARTDDEALSNILVLDMGGRSTTVTIFAEGRTYLTRIIEFGIEHIEDKNYKEEYSIKVIRPQIEYNILSEVERILHFYYSTKEANPIRRIYLIGGGANVKGMESYIRDALNIPVESIDFLEYITDVPEIKFKQQISLFINILGAVYGL